MTSVPLTVFTQDLHLLPHSLGKYFKRCITLETSRSCGGDVSVHRSHLLDTHLNYIMSVVHTVTSQSLGSAGIVGSLNL